MEVEKRSSRGGFLQLFDWNAKSRKKLFSNKSELSGNCKQGNDSSNSRLHKVHDNGCGPSTGGSNDLNYASSFNGDDGCGTKAPGVVARLMGLDSLPTLNASEQPLYTPLHDSQSFREYSRGISDFGDEDHIVIYDSMRNKLDGFTKNPVDMMLQKVHNRPIERFQSEVLPPKSAKPISITHHRLMSPIKSPGFMPSMNAAYLMEAAAKIIDQNPRSAATHKLPSLGSSSVPLKIQDLREKMEAAHRSARIIEASRISNEQNSYKQMKRQPRDKVGGRGEAPDSGRVVSDASKSSGPRDLRNKERSVSLAVQAKANVQKKDRYTSVGNRSSASQKDHGDANCSSAARNQPKYQKAAERRTTVNRPEVLRPNNQKQNCPPNDDRESSRSSFSQQKDRKSVSTNEVSRSRTSKTVNRIDANTATSSRKTSINQVVKDQSLSTMRKSTGKKQLVNGTTGDRSSLMKQGERSVKCNIETDRCSGWDAAERKSGMDVVSFTFTSPIKKSVSASSSPGHAVEKKRGSFGVSSSSENQASFGLSLSGSDALGLLLEQKLKELTSKIESPHRELDQPEYGSTSVNSSGDSTSNLNMGNMKSGENDKRPQFHTPKDRSDAQAMELWKRVEKTEDPGSVGFHGYDRDLRHQTAPRLEPVYSEGSCNSFDGSRSNSSEAKKLSSFETYEMAQWSSTRKSQPVEDMELSDCASSISLGATSATDMSSSFTSMVANESSSNWEYEYIRNILMNRDLMLQEFSLGQVHRIIAPNPFDQFGDEKSGSNRHSEENFKVTQKLLFHFVEESLELRCARLFSGSWKSWAKLTTTFQRKEWLTEELCRDISGWISMEDLMVDELVDRDMSTHVGKWVDFETEAFEEGVDIEKGILSALVDELVDDFLA